MYLEGMKTPMPKPKAYSYVRFSRPEQAKGDSYRRQTEAAEAWARDHGMELDERLYDKGISAYRGRNADEGALGSFLAAVREGKVERGSTLVVESLDRISRQDILTALGLFVEILKAGVQIATLSDGFLYTEEAASENPFQLIISLTILSRAHEESRIKGERVAAAWARKRVLARDKKTPISRITPEWIELRDGQYHLVPERVKIVRRIFEETVSGLGKRTITKKLNQDGIPTFGRGERRASAWQESYISKMLSSPMAIGWYQPHRLVDGKRIPDGEPVQDFYPPAIDDATFWNAKAAAESRQTGAAGRKGRTYANLLGGIAKCVCGASMTYVYKGTVAKAGLPKLVCNNSLRKLGCTRSKRYRYIYAEAGVFFGLNGAQMRSLIETQSDEQKKLETDVNAQEAKLADLNKRLGRLLDIAESDDADDQVKERINRIRGEIKVGKASLATMRANLSKMIATPAAEAEGTLLPLYRQLQSLEGDDLYMARAALAQQLRRWVRKVEFDNGWIAITYADGSTARGQLVG